MIGMFSFKSFDMQYAPFLSFILFFQEYLVWRLFIYCSLVLHTDLQGIKIYVFINLSIETAIKLKLQTNLKLLYP